MSRRTGGAGGAVELKELESLRAWARELEDAFPADPVARLKKRLQAAVTEERYDEAARIRDALKKLADGRPKP